MFILKHDQCCQGISQQCLDIWHVIYPSQYSPEMRSIGKSTHETGRLFDWDIKIRLVAYVLMGKHALGCFTLEIEYQNPRALARSWSAQTNHCPGSGIRLGAHLSLPGWNSCMCMAVYSNFACQEAQEPFALRKHATKMGSMQQERGRHQEYWVASGIQLANRNGIMNG